MDPLLILLGAIEIQKKLNYPVSRLQTFMRGGLLQALVQFYHCWERNNLTQLESQQGWGCHRPSHMRMVASGTGQQSQPQASHLDSTKKRFGPLATNTQGHQPCGEWWAGGLLFLFSQKKCKAKWENTRTLPREAAGFGTR